MRQYTLEVLPKFPARVDAGVGIGIDKANGVYEFNVDYDNAPPIATITDPNNTRVLVRLPDGSYATVPVAAAAGLASAFFETRTDATIARIATSAEGGAEIVVTSSYAGNGGGASYIRASGPTPGGFQSADGQWWQLAEQPIDVRMLGAKFDYDPVTHTGTDDTVAIQAAIDLVASRGGGEVLLPAGYTLVSSAGLGAAALNVVTGQDNVSLIGEGSAQTVICKNASTVFINVGTPTSGPVTDQGNLLASDAAVGAQTVTVAAGKGANFTAGSWCRIISEAVITGQDPVIVTAKMGELITIESVAGDVLTLAAPLRYAYATANTAQVQNMNWIEGFRLKGIGFDGHDYLTGGSVNNDNGILIYWARQPYFEDIGGFKFPNVFLLLEGCAQFTFAPGCWARDLLSDDVFGAVGKFGYAVCAGGMCEGGTITGLVVERARHAFTTVERSAAMANPSYGIPTGIVISNGVANDMRGTGWDTHPGALAIIFENLATLGSIGGGLAIRGTNCLVSNCRAQDCVAFAFYATTSAINCRLANFNYSNCNTGIWDSIDWTIKPAIYDLGTRTSGEDLVVLWTPTLSFVTPGNLATAYSVQVGRGIRKGNLFFYWVTVVATTFTHSTATGDFVIMGFPYACATVPGQTTPGAISGLGAGFTWPAGTTSLAALVTTGESQARIRAVGSATAAVSFGIANAPSGSAKSVSIAGCYEVAALQ